MTKALFFLIPLAAAVAMPLWMARCRQRESGRRWALHWLATLLPLGAVLVLHGLGWMAGLNNTVTLPLIAVAVVALSAFAGGALYLFIPPVFLKLKTLNVANPHGRMAEANTPTRRREDENDVVPAGHRRSSNGNHYEPIDYGDEESDDYYRNGEPG